MNRRKRKTGLGALKDVSDSLVSYKEARERRAEEAEHVKSAADAVRFARLRYSGGNASYLEVLTTDTDLYSAQLLLVQAQQQEASSLVQLYSALGEVGSNRRYSRIVGNSELVHVAGKRASP